ncbi:MAG: hypothetical protein V4637_18950 [Pseudomonadota bacterium]
MQQLQAIPERQRTDAEWDELNELEIMLASGNRELPPGQQQHGMRGGGNQPNQSQGQRRDLGAPDGRNPSRKFHKRSSKRRGPGPGPGPTG